jgi:4'-phosphopantetheinyl transferase
LLSNDERERATRFRSDTARLNFVMTRGTLRYLLSGYLNIEPQDISFEYSINGKPRLSDSFDLHFNVSHTEGLALLAFAQGREIGIDVEKINLEADNGGLMGRLSFGWRESSFEGLSFQEVNLRFFQSWTRNEAYVKACGDSLTIPARSRNRRVAESGLQGLTNPECTASNIQGWIVQALSIGQDYAAALVVQS